MSLIIPEVILQITCNNILQILRDDYNTVVTVGGGNESDTLLYRTLANLVIANYDMFEEAKTILLTKENIDPRHIKVNLSYNPEDATYPSVHISLPNEQTGMMDSVGIGEGDNLPVVGDSDTSYERNFTRSYKSLYNIVILSDNKNEIVLLYHLFKAGLIVFQEHMELAGLQNLKIYGSDINWNSQIAPGLFVRSIQTDFTYDIVVTDWLSRAVIKNLNLNYKIVDDLNL